MASRPEAKRTTAPTSNAIRNGPASCTGRRSRSARGGAIRDDPSLEDDEQAIREFDQFRQLFRNEQGRRAGRARLRQLLVDEGDASHVDATGGVGREQQPRCLTNFAAKYQALQVPAREGTGGA